MCNFYMMYYTEEISVERRECWGMTVLHAESLFPQSADDLAPYPGFAGQGNATHFQFVLLMYLFEC